MKIEPIPNDCLPFNGDEQKLLALLRGPKLDAGGKIQGGTYDGMTPDDVIAQRDRYRRIVGE